MIRIHHQVVLQYQIGPQGADLILNVHAAFTPQQSVFNERLQMSQPIAPEMFTEAATGTRFMRLRAQSGALRIQHSAIVDLQHFQIEPGGIVEIPVTELPVEALTYLNPSRYCQSDQFSQLAMAQFGGVPRGYRRVQVIRDWVQQHIEFKSNASTSNTSAIETLQSGQGVCRDFAHLMITLCRALCIPARFTTGTDWGADPSLGPPDFHAYVEVYLSGGWYIFDPSGTATPMSFIRIGTGRDAADVPFASLYGDVRASAPIIYSHPLTGDDIELPRETADALSTDVGSCWRH